jgi:ribosomal protein L7/L12
MSLNSDSELTRHLKPIFDRLRNIEEQLAILSEKAGMPYARVADVVPAEVLQLARAGDQLGAIKLYRELTGASRNDARDVISAI